MKLILLVVCLLMVGCGPSPTMASPLPMPCVEKFWPQPNPDGLFGHEDPSYPPTLEECERGLSPLDVPYYPLYNGQNWVCYGGAGYIVLPKGAGR